MNKREFRNAHYDIKNYTKRLEQQLDDWKKQVPVIHHIVDLLPKIIWNYHTVSISGSTWIWTTIPWNWKLRDQIHEELIKAGFVLTYEKDTKDMKDKEFHYHFKLFPDSYESVHYELDMKGDSVDSKCVLVPIVTEKKIREVTYDHVCPDEHPELFTTNEKGELVYVGDNLFPAVKEEA